MSVERLVVGTVVGGSLLISPVVERIAAVIRLICAPTWADAAVLVMRSEDAERGARVASEVVCLSWVLLYWMVRRRVLLIAPV
jgi:hypothetical protein